MALKMLIEPIINEYLRDLIDVILKKTFYLLNLIAPFEDGIPRRLIKTYLDLKKGTLIVK